MSKQLFERLMSTAEQRGVVVANADQGRYIKQLNDEDATLMSSAHTELIVVSRQVRLVKIEFKEDIYYCIFGITDSDLELEGLESVEMTPGIFALSILESRVHPPTAISGSEIRNAIEDRYISANGFQGFDLSEIEALFPKASLFKISLRVPYTTSDSYRVLGAIISRSYSDGPIAISGDTLEVLHDIFVNGSEYLPFKNLVQGVMSISWEGLYLEVYRCLEQLYSEPRIANLVSVMPSENHSIREIASLLETHLSWRPKEDDSLAKVISGSKEHLIEELCRSLGASVNQKADMHEARVAAKKVYSIRNQIVHYRPANQPLTKNDEEWNAIVSALLYIVDDIYKNKGQGFFQKRPEAKRTGRRVLEK
ncbi:hypothetical protein ACM7ZX_29500 [Pseudomonas aeruginosa]